MTLTFTSLSVLSPGEFEEMQGIPSRLVLTERFFQYVLCESNEAVCSNDTSRLKVKGSQACLCPQLKNIFIWAQVGPVIYT